MAALEKPSYHCCALLGGESPVEGSFVHLIYRDTLFKEKEGTLTIPITGEKYVKFRNLRVRPSSNGNPVGTDEWIQFGNPCQVSINLSDIEKEGTRLLNKKTTLTVETLQGAVKNLVSYRKLEIVPRGEFPLNRRIKMSTGLRAGTIQVIFKKIIGSGTFKIVSLYTYESGDKVVRAKPCLSKSNPDLNEIVRFKNEIYVANYLIKMGVPGILRLTEIVGDDPLKIRSEMPLCDLLEPLVEEAPRVEDLPRRSRWAIEAATTLAKINDLILVYNDTKISNFLIHEDHIVIADLGSIARFGSTRNPGTYPCPEMCEPKQRQNMWAKTPDFRANPKNDSWGFGIVLFLLFHGRKKYDPIFTMSWDAGGASVVKGANSIQALLHKSEHPIIQRADAVISKLLEINPRQRLSIADARIILEGDSLPTQEIIGGPALKSPSSEQGVPLHQYLRNTEMSGRLEFQRRVAFATQLAKIMATMHSRGDCHGSIARACRINGNELILCGPDSTPKPKEQIGFIHPSTDIYGFGLVLCGLIHTKSFFESGIESQIIWPSASNSTSHQTTKPLHDYLDLTTTPDRMIKEATTPRASQNTMREIFDELMKFYSSILCLDAKSFEELLKKFKS